MITAQQRALRKIKKGTTAWEKTKAGLEKAVDVLWGVIDKKATKIEKLEFESAWLLDQVRSTGNFIANTDSLYKTPVISIEDN